MSLPLAIENFQSKQSGIFGSSKAWWSMPVKRSQSMGPINIPPLSVQVSSQNDLALLELLRFTGVENQTGILINIGLPTESFTFASKGYKVFAFEARKSAYDTLQRRIRGKKLSQQISLANVALSNYTGRASLWSARDSSSLAETAITKGPEYKKWSEEKKQREEVNVARLDDFVSQAVGMKIDVQGLEPEILMGASKLFGSLSKPMVILMEYCSRLRPFSELVPGVHLLRGLGYTCHHRKFGGKELRLDEHLDFCGDLMCLLQNHTDMIG